MVFEVRADTRNVNLKENQNNFVLYLNLPEFNFELSSIQT
jgi:hypothetical protein